MKTEGIRYLYPEKQLLLEHLKNLLKLITGFPVRARHQLAQQAMLEFLVM